VEHRREAALGDRHPRFHAGFQSGVVRHVEQPVRQLVEVVAALAVTALLAVGALNPAPATGVLGVAVTLHERVQMLERVQRVADLVQHQTGHHGAGRGDRQVLVEDGLVGDGDVLGAGDGRCTHALGERDDVAVTGVGVTQRVDDALHGVGDGNDVFRRAVISANGAALDARLAERVGEDCQCHGVLSWDG